MDTDGPIINIAVDNNNSQLKRRGKRPTQPHIMETITIIITILIMKIQDSERGGEGHMRTAAVSQSHTELLCFESNRE